MVLQPVNSISYFTSPVAPAEVSGSSQAFISQLDTAMAAPAKNTVAAPAAPVIQSVTVLPWGQSIAYTMPPTTSAPATPAITAPAISTPAATSAAAQATPRTATANVETAPVLPPSQQAMNALSAALNKYGIDSSGLGLSYSEQQVMGPTGSYTNKLITANLPNGKTQQFSADLVLLNANVTAAEISSLMGKPIWA